MGAWPCQRFASELGGYNGESDIKYLNSFHSWIVDMVAVLLIAIIKVTVELEDVNITVAYHQRCLLYNRLSLQQWLTWSLDS